MWERAECRQAVWQPKSISERQGKNAGRPLFSLSVPQSVVSVDQPKCARVCVLCHVYSLVSRVFCKIEFRPPDLPWGSTKVM